MIHLLFLIVVWPYALFLFFLGYVTVMEAKEKDRLKDAHWIFKVAAWITVMIGGFIDISFNLIPGSILFWEWPEYRNITFTHRCAKWMKDEGRRGKMARSICKNLGVFQVEHCKPR